jgi:hypothetical protein
VNITEGNIEVRDVPEITLKDKPLAECNTAIVAREIMSLVRLLQEKRARINQLERYIKSLAEQTPHEWLQEDVEELFK